MKHLAGAFTLALIVVTGTPACDAMAQDITASIRGSVTKQPIPRFVSLKSGKVNGRGGPTKDHDVTWIYQRSGLPVEVTAEFDNWRRIRDWDGSESWVFHSMLSHKRTAMVRPANADELVPLHQKASRESAVSARLEGRVMATVKLCNGQWCRIQGEGFDGWVEQNRLWGIYPHERYPDDNAN